MSFVFVLRRGPQSRSAELLAKALKARDQDVCIGVDDQPGELRADIGRAMADHCSVAVALWSEADLTDPVILELMSYAKARGRLLAIGPATAQLPPNLGGSMQAPQIWSDRDPAVLALCDVICKRAEENPNESETAFRASEEYAACARMHKKNNVEAMASFLRAFPGGMFEDIVRAELDAATRPSYEANAGRGWRFLDAPRTAEVEKAADVWRLDAWSPRQALERLDRRWLWTGAVVAVAATLLLILSLLAHRPNAHADWTNGVNNRLAGGATAGGSVSLSPPEAHADNAISPHSAAARLASSAPPQAPTAPPLALGATRADGPPSIVQSPDVQSAATNAPLASPQPMQAAPEPARAEPTSQAPPPVRAAATDAHAYDAARLEAGMRETVALARRNEVRANGAAASRAGATGARETLAGHSARGMGVYSGEWSNGAAQGLGRAVWANGDAYQGAWRNSEPNGSGVLNLASGLRYEGEFANGSPTGHGVFWGADGQRLVGDQLFAALVNARAQ